MTPTPEAEPVAPTRGLYRKYKITRTDGGHRAGRKHEHCAYFVLDLAHDPYALEALKAYARACRKELPSLADDIGVVLEAQKHLNVRFGPTNASEQAVDLMDRAEKASTP